MFRRTLFVITLLLCQRIAYSQCVPINLVLPDTICTNTDVVFQRVTASSYHWDFCPGDLSGVPVLNADIGSNVSRGLGLDMVVEGGQYYIFTTGYDGTLKRSNFGNSPENTPTVTNLTLSKTPITPFQYQQFKVNNNWYGLATCVGSSPAVYSFPSLTSNSVSVSFLDTIPAGCTGLATLVDHDTVFAIFSSNSYMKVYRLDNTLSNPVLIQTFYGVSYISQLELVRDCNGIVLFGVGSGGLTQVVFGNSLYNTPVVTVHNLPGFNNPNGLAPTVDMGQQYVFVLNTNGQNIMQVSFPSGFGGLPGATTQLAPALPSGLMALNALHDKSRWYLFTYPEQPNPTVKLSRLVFPENNCNTSISSLNTSIPIGLNYSAAGTYIVELSAFYSNGSMVSTIDTINITATPGHFADFTVYNTCLDSQASFVYSPIRDICGGILNYQWDFGDGFQSNLSNPVHSYSSIGFYNVKLVINTISGYSDSITKQIKVGRKPGSNFTAPSSCSFLPIQFMDGSVFGDTVARWFWDFGDGQTSTSQNPVHTYTQAGSYPVSLTLYGKTSCDSTITKNVVITGVDPDFVSNNACLGQTTQFTDSSKNNGQSIAKWLWDFGTGISADTSNLQNPTFQYSAPGNYSVTLRISTTAGCNSMIVKNIFVAPLPDVSLVVDGDLCLPNAVLKVKKNTPISISTYSWNFNGVQIFGNNPTLAVNNLSTGIYPYFVTVTSTDGCPVILHDTLRVGVSTELVVMDTTCGNAPLTLNVPFGGNTTIWDFCSGDIANMPILTQGIATSPKNGGGIVLVEQNGNWFGYSVSTTTSSIIRFDFGTNLGNNSPITTEITVTGTAITNPYTLQAVSGDSGKIYLFIASRTPNKGILRVRLNSATDTIPVCEAISGTTVYSGFSGVSVTKEKGSWFLLTYYYGSNELNIFSLGSSLESSATFIQKYTTNFSTASGGITTVQECGATYVFVCGENSSSGLHRFTFNSGLAGSATFTSITLPAGVLLNPVMPVPVYDKGNRYLLIQNMGGSVSRVNFGSKWSNSTITDADKINLTLNGMYFVAFTGAFSQSKYYFFGTAYSDNSGLNRLVFPDSCSATIPSSSDYLPSPVYYTQTGKNYIQLLQRDANGITKVYLDSVYVNSSNADFSFTLGCLGVPVQFTDLSNLGGTRSWDFGDGNTSTALNPTNIYILPGNYTVRLLAANTQGCSQVQVKNITVHETPDAKFNFISRCATLPVQFFDSSTISNGNIVFRKWDFGDGTVDYSPNPTHAYTTGGVKSVALIAVSDKGCSDTLIQTLTLPVFDFSYQNTCVGQTTNFTANTNYNSDAIIGYSWNFGDLASGSANTSTQKDPTHQFSGLGQYMVRFVVQTASGCSDTLYKMIEITAPPTVNFQTMGACVGKTVTFIDATTLLGGVITSWSWDFGDPASGSLNTSMLQNPNHLYFAQGTYNITLSVTVSGGCNVVYSKQITISDSPKANFSTAGQSCQYTYIPFTDQSSAGNSPIVSWYWEFGNGVFSTLANPLMSYADTGNYTVMLIVFNQNGCSDTTQQIIRITNKPNADFTVSTTTGDSPLVVLFTPLQFVNTIQFSWNFGDGITSLDSFPTHTYSQRGTYRAMLIVSNGICQDTISKTITVTQPIPEIPDLAVLDLGAQLSGNKLRIAAQIQNKGNTPVHKFNWVIQVQNQLSVIDPFQGDTIFPGQIVSYSPANTYIVNSHDLSIFYCVELTNPNDTLDAYPLDNSRCQTFNTPVAVRPLYPNPVHNQLHIDVITSDPLNITLRVVDEVGKIISAGIQKNCIKGLNSIILPCSEIATGNYFLEVQYNNTKVFLRFIKE